MDKENMKQSELMDKTHTLTIEGMEQRDQDGNIFLKDCITLNGTFNSITLWNMVTTIRNEFPKLTDNDLDVVHMGTHHAIKHRTWYVNMLPTEIYIQQTGSYSVGFSRIPYSDIASIELDFFLDGSTLVGIWINLVSGLQIRLF